MKAWVWFVRQFGIRIAYLYWRSGHRRGWMTDDEAQAWLDALYATHNALNKVDL